MLLPGELGVWPGKKTFIRSVSGSVLRSQAKEISGDVVSSKVSYRKACRMAVLSYLWF